MIDLGASDFESVRKLIDVQLTADQLPDTVLGLDAYEGEAIRWVAQRTDNEDADARNAAVYVLAVLVIPALPRFLSESNAGYSYSLEKVDWKARIEQLMYLAENAISRSETANPTPTGDAYDSGATMSHFDVAPADTLTKLWWEEPSLNA